jgi:hypothetical protein
LTSFFCTAAAAVTEILNVCLQILSFVSAKKLKSSHFVQILFVVCQNFLNQLDVNKQSLIRANCSIVTVRATANGFVDHSMVDQSLRYIYLRAIVHLNNSAAVY